MSHKYVVMSLFIKLNVLAFFVPLICSPTVASAEQFRGFVRQITKTAEPSSVATTISPTITLSPSTQPPVSSMPSFETNSLPLSIFPPTIPNPVFYFNSVPQLTACTPAIFTWVYSGPYGVLQLNITNQLLSQVLASATPSSSPPLPVTSTISASATTSTSYITQSITLGTNPLQGSYTWKIVDVPEGVYVLHAFMPSIELARVSPQFNVVNGSDVSCLLATNKPPQSSQTIVAGTAASKKSVKTGAIAGAIIGGIAVLAIAIVIFLHTYRQRRILRARSASAIWAGLSSKDYSGGSGNFRSHSRGISTATHRDIVHQQPFADRNPSTLPVEVQDDTNVSHCASDEDATIASPSEEKFPTSPDEETDADHGTIAPLSYTPSHYRRGSNSSNRSYSSRNRDHTIAFDAPTTPSAARRRSGDYRPPPTSLTHAIPGSPAEYVHGAEMIPMARSASVGSSIRRANRKPVPQYDPNELEGTHPTITNGNGNGKGTQHDFDSESFVGKLGDFTKPVHYLIPDMPPPSPRR